jgi:transposase InsO family protein
MVSLAGVSRASYYRFDPEATGPVRDVDLRDLIQRLALRYPAYGRPRLTAELKRQGWAVNHKRVGRILREDNLLCLRKRKFVVTTDSAHDFRVYPNLARRCGCLLTTRHRVGAGAHAGSIADSQRSANGAGQTGRAIGADSPF